MKIIYDHNKMSDKFYEGEIYHVFNKSIANFNIFYNDNNSKRFLEALEYYNSKTAYCLAYAIEKKKYYYHNVLIPKTDAFVKFISYCIMPDHYHFLVKILKTHIISKYISDVENSYTRYFNINFKRKGPLWQSRFKAVKIKNNEQLLHVSRYIHLNPTTNKLVNDPEDWRQSSYKDIIGNKIFLEKYLTEISIRSAAYYEKFTEDQIDYQQKLKQIKRLLLD